MRAKSAAMAVLAGVVLAGGSGLASPYSFSTFDVPLSGVTTNCVSGISMVPSNFIRDGQLGLSFSSFWEMSDKATDT